MGYAREVFFWALLSALTMLVLGAGLSLWRGLSQLFRPDALERPLLALGVVVLSTLTNGYAVSRSVKRLRAENPSLRLAYRATSLQLVKTALLQDLLGTASAIIGVFTISGYLLFDAVRLDAVGALALAGLMVAFSGILVSEARSLIAGRAVPTQIRDALVMAITGLPEVTGVNRLDAVFSGSEDILVDADLDLAENLTTSQIEKTIDRVQEAVRAIAPAVSSVSIDLNSPAFITSASQS